ncbi:MAG: CorA-like Mg2+ transporter protein [Methanomassiliicoccales archaeon PtaU1.Bin124]|nr:MAG: CorA-like Mg2+ transporter protein [Methanomassiliicoccales archaeon PtaU1.Bin124]
MEASNDKNGNGKLAQCQNGSIPTEGELPPPTQSVICVSLPQLSARPVKTMGNAPEEFLATVQKSTLSWVNYAAEDLEKDGTRVAQMYGFSESMIATLLKGYYASFEDREVELGIMVPAVRVRGAELKVFPLLILVKRNLILSIHSKEVSRIVLFSRYADTYLRKLPDVMPQEDKLTMMLVRILDENNTRNFEQLREIEERADEMSEILIDPNSPRITIGRQIYEMKHSLITYLNTLWRTLDVVNSLRYGDAEVVTDNPKVLAKVGLLADELNRQIELSEHMSEVLASGLEVLQSLYNNQLQILNNRMSLTMTWLTILGTAVLVPNTLATIFGYVFGLSWDLIIWSLGVITFASVGATVLAYWWVKRRVNLPSRADELER